MEKHYAIHNGMGSMVHYCLVIGFATFPSPTEGHWWTVPDRNLAGTQKLWNWRRLISIHINHKSTEKDFQMKSLCSPHLRGSDEIWQCHVNLTSIKDAAFLPYCARHPETAMRTALSIWTFESCRWPSWGSCSQTEHTWESCTWQFSHGRNPSHLRVYSYTPPSG